MRYLLCRLLFFRPEDAAKAMEASHEKMFFGTKIHVTSHEGFRKFLLIFKH